MIHQKQQASASNQSGFTIIESLVAIVVVGILLAAIAPVIVLSVATRVQARRVEMATDAAKTYIDGVRSRTIPPPPITDTTDSLGNYPAPPVGTLTCNTANAYCSAPATNLYCVDGDADGSGCTMSSIRDFIIQALRRNTTSTTSQDTYQLRIRIYRADAFANDGGNLTIEPTKQLIFTNKASDRKAPLLETTTEISSKVTTFSDFCTRLKPPASNSNPQSNC
ncbi:type II secretion system protein [Tolypothrix campylonemoides VB511288]|nr:type II secretion system protein [Tolypothrix campylonemoides VB511288]